MSVSDVQIWTTLGVFAAFAIGALGVVSSLFVRVLRSEVGRLEAKMDARFDAVTQRIDTLDRDVQALYRHTFGIDRD
ncbi:MAG: hypothetical protein QM635_04435 [Microbacteriaceae bacterium]